MYLRKWNERWEPIQSKNISFNPSNCLHLFRNARISLVRKKPITGGTLIEFSNNGQNIALERVPRSNFVYFELHENVYLRIALPT